MFRKLLTLALVLAVFATSCAAPATPTPKPTTVPPTKVPPTAVPSTEPIYIGLTGPMTGSGAAQGGWALIGAQQAADELNAVGGLNGRPIELVPYDDKGDNQEGSLVAQRYVEDDRIFAVIGPMWSGVTMAANPIYAAANMPTVNPTSSAHAVTEQGWTNLVRITFKDLAAQPQVTAFLVNNLGRKKIAVFYALDDYGRGVLDVVKQYAPQLGAEVVDEEPVNTGTDTDFSVQLTRAERAGATGILLGCQYNENSLIVAQAAQLGLTVNNKIVLVGDANNMQQVSLDRVGPDAEDAFFLVTPHNPYDDRAVVKSFNAFFEEKMDTVPNQTAAYSYDALYIIAAAVNAGATKETLIDKIKSMTFKDLYVAETVTFDEFGDRQNPSASVLRIKDHKFQSAGMTVDTTGVTFGE
jgi:branched-chain amino acid transport system substrate-binding protein